MHNIYYLSNSWVMCIEYILPLDFKKEGKGRGYRTKCVMISLEMLLGERYLMLMVTSTPSLKHFLGLAGYTIYDSPSLHCAIPGEKTTRERKEQSLNVPLK